MTQEKWHRRGRNRCNGEGKVLGGKHWATSAKALSWSFCDLSSILPANAVWNCPGCLWARPPVHFLSAGLLGHPARPVAPTYPLIPPPFFSPPGQGELQLWTLSLVCPCSRKDSAMLLWSLPSFSSHRAPSPSTSGLL